MKNLSTIKVKAMVFCGNYIVTSSGRVFRVDPETGQPVSERKLTINGSGYRVFSIRIKGKIKTFMVHRLVWTCFKGAIPKGLDVDHIKENKTDNRLCNLQLLTRKENSIKRCLSRPNQKRFRKYKRGYMPNVFDGGKRIILPLCQTKKEATDLSILWMHEKYSHLMNKRMRSYCERLIKKKGAKC